jgi:F-type H+-transporting ATPase subunit delta
MDADDDRPWTEDASVAVRRGSARRYAEAAFEIAQRDDSVAGWLGGLDTAVERLSEPRVARVLANPAIPFPERRALVERLLGTDVTGPPRNLVLLLVRRNRAHELADVARELRRLQAKREGVVQATVTSALPLTEDEMAALRERLATITGGRIEMDTRTDPAILGGIQVRLGDRLIDGSVRGRLERLRTRIASGSI